MHRFATSTLHAGLLSTFLSFGSLTVAGHAQERGRMLKVDVPFAFENGSRHFSAGKYLIRLEADHKLVLEGASERFVTYTVSDERLTITRKSAVIFRRYGDRYFLREVWPSGQNRLVHLLPTKEEKQVEVTMKHQQASGIVVASLDSPK